MVNFKIEWHEALPKTSVYTVGDVKDVLNSRANGLVSIPDMTHGIGLISADTAENAGEALVFHRYAGIAPFESTKQPYWLYPNSSNVRTPFCIGWRGEPTGIGVFSAESPVSLNNLYQTLLETLPYENIPLIGLEIWAILPVSAIYDRVLNRSANTGGISITSDQYAKEYFRFKTIAADLPDDVEILPLAIIGVGLDRRARWNEEQTRFADAAFYTAPGEDETAVHDIVTHSHALGWRNNYQLSAKIRDLTEIKERQNPPTFLDENFIKSQLNTAPDYVVHLDDWSQLIQGVVRVFVPTDVAFIDTKIPDSFI